MKKAERPAADNSGNGNTGTLGGGTAAYRPTWARGKNGNGLSFDGSNDYVLISNATPIYSNTEPHTFFAWVKLNAYTVDYAWVLNNGGTTSGTSLIVSSIGKIGFFYAGGGAVKYSNTTLALNTLYYITAVYDGSGNISFYLNGVLDGTQSTGATTWTNIQDKANRNIGAWWNTAYVFNGLIDDVRIYNYARTPRQIAWDFNNGKPAGWWKLDEGTGTSVKDNGGLCQLLSSYCHNGTISGATWTTSGKFFNALSFLPASSPYVTIGSTGLSINSVSFWINPNSVTDSFIDLDGGTHKISVSAGAVSASGFATPTYYINGIATASPTITASGWQHIEVTTDTAFTASNMVLGKIDADYLDGVIDDVRVYSYVRTASDVLKDYGGSAVKF